MIARALILAIVLLAVVAGAALYYFQVYAYYDEVSAEEVGGVLLVRADTGAPEPVSFENFRAIDSNSSPVRFRACFDPVASPAALAGTYAAYPRAVPLNAPGWFDCFDAAEIGAALESGAAFALLGVENVTYGIDRVVAVMPDGSARAWHQINRCGAVVFDGNPAPADCPPAPESLN